MTNKIRDAAIEAAARVQVPLQCSFDTLSEAITQTYAGELAEALQEALPLIATYYRPDYGQKARAALAKFKEIAG